MFPIGVVLFRLLQMVEMLSKPTPNEKRHGWDLQSSLYQIFFAFVILDQMFRIKDSFDRNYDDLGSVLRVKKI